MPKTRLLVQFPVMVTFTLHEDNASGHRSAYSGHAPDVAARGRGEPQLMQCIEVECPPFHLASWIQYAGMIKKSLERTNSLGQATRHSYRADEFLPALQSLAAECGQG